MRKKVHSVIPPNCFNFTTTIIYFTRLVYEKHGVNIGLMGMQALEHEHKLIKAILANVGGYILTNKGVSDTIVRINLSRESKLEQSILELKNGQIKKRKMEKVLKIRII